jgi:hypothetical protein
VGAQSADRKAGDVMTDKSKKKKTLDPRLVAEWHPTRNSPLMPDMVTPGSGQMVWWRCEHGHEWRTTVNSRRKTACPYCAGLLATPENNLAAKFPQLSREWHPTKNRALRPEEVPPFSHTRVWWICCEGHEWQARVANRTKLGRGCPYCAGRYATLENNLAVKFPDLCREWHRTKNGALRPEEVSPFSNKRVWWKCVKDPQHQWQAAVHSRAQGKGCPYCTGRQPSKTNNLAAIVPHLVEEWHPTKNDGLTPDKITRRSGKKVWWKCQHDHEWPATVDNRVRGSGCPYCAGLLATPENNLAVKFPDLCREWHPTKNGALRPEDVPPFSSKRVWWKCERGHSWPTVIANRTNGGHNCPICRPSTSRAEIRLLCELNSLFDETHWQPRVAGVSCDIHIPKYQIAVEYDGSYWHRTKTEDDEQKAWKLQCAGIMLFRVREAGLPKLSERDVLLEPEEHGFSMLRKLLESILAHAAVSDPDRVTINHYISAEKFLNEAEYQRRRSCLPGPPYEKSLAHLFPHLADEWDYDRNLTLLPEKLKPSTHEKVWWRCLKNAGHPGWQATVANRTKGRGCPACSCRTVTADNCLAAKFPDIAQEWHPTKNGDRHPHNVAPYSNKYAWWKCREGHEWYASIGNRTQFNRGCKECKKAKRQADTLKPSGDSHF